MSEKSNDSTNGQDCIVEKQYKYLSEISKVIYDNECSLENNYMNQSYRLQKVISILMIVILITVPILFRYSIFPKEYIATWIIIVFLFLLSSLIFASISQYRRKRTNFPNISDVHKKMASEYNNFKTDAQRNKYICAIYEEIQSSYFVENEHTKRLLKISIVLFICALFICLLAMFVLILLLLK